MTAPRDPDDLASALLDGLLPDDEAAAARRDPAVAARLAELAAVRAALRREPPPADPVARERGLTAALAAFDAGRQDAGEGGESRHADGPETAPVAPMTRSRTATRVDARRRGRWLTAAAVVLAVVGLGFLARDWGANDDDDAAESATESSATQGDAGAGTSAESGDAEAAEEDAGAAAASLVPDLGEVDSPDALAAEARAAVAEKLPQRSGTEDASPQPTCPDGNQPPLAAPDGTVVLRARASLEGEPVDVWVLDTDGGSRVVAVDVTCTVVVDEPLGD
jgi:hypothetical protein